MESTDRDAAADLLKRRRDAQRHNRRRQQGYGKPIQYYPLAQGRKAVVIGRALMVGDWSTFTDFLLDYLAERLGRGWIADEMRKPDGHPIGQWASKMGRSPRAAVPAGQVAKATINNAFRSVLTLAYNLYLIEHHYEQYNEPLLERLLRRLRVADGFWPAVSEVNAAAAFLKAGFSLRYDDDLAPGEHAEFTATFAETRRRFSVEVKTRTGSISPELNPIDQVKLKNKLSKALRKSLPWTRVVFVDMNLPVLIDQDQTHMLDAMLAKVKEAEDSLRISGRPAPAAYLFLVNQPFHYHHESLEGASVVAALGFRLPSFQPRSPATFRQVILGREQHPEMHALIESIKIHSEPPSTFDGQEPEFAFAPKENHPRWIIGNEYLVPDADGNAVLARLVSASAHAESAKMHGIFEKDGENFMVSCPMTEAEVTVYRRNPETFFGVVQSVGTKANDAFDLAEFLYSTYRHSSKEKLLEFLKDHPALEKMRSWPQKELAIFVSEQWALAAEAQGSEQRAKA
ncbi:hypothetical protein [Bradyrhizobium sp. CIR3A]|uniref:hypothetical protein n=1 Tax=Bradyrhizobium sp. CIR3A TaxID=2663838 RepID=UPI0017C582C5|nr:hypothetical protein [Bradyrhizobium sp. CIR3A]MBB4259975.1 hypothetical protein [Bradyrhizobium sp. CIR3A]